MKIKAVIFDLDGTLLNSIVGIADAMNSLLERLGYPTHSVEAYKYFVGDGITDMVARTLPENCRENCDMDAMVKEYRAIYDTTWPQKSPPYPGIPELLDALCAQGIKISILSNKSEDFTRRMTTALLPDWKFEIVRGAREGVPRKPDPLAVLEIAEFTGIPPENSIFVGDTDIDMQTGVRAKMSPVGVLWGFRGKEELVSNGAKHIINTPLELLEISD
ncbi:MAG: HAD family hydrolase [bacterium]|nr:HAD family hydrolase [bacterium]